MARLPRVSWLRRGYAVRQVDAAVRTVEQALAQDPPGVTATDVRRLGFELRHHGYQIAATDALLDELELRCTKAALGAVPPWQVADEATRDLERLRNSTGPADGARFPRVGRLRRGYDVAQVDRLLERCTSDLGELRVTAESSPRTGTVAPDDVRGTVFRRSRHGYQEEAVDRTFDEVIDLLLRRDALVAGLAPRGRSSSRDSRADGGLDSASGPGATSR
jgi:DivIVA domain-containing protein